MNRRAFVGLLISLPVLKGLPAGAAVLRASGATPPAVAPLPSTGAAKAWVTMAADGATWDGYGVQSIRRNGVGDYTITFNEIVPEMVVAASPSGPVHILKTAGRQLRATAPTSALSLVVLG